MIRRQARQRRDYLHRRALQLQEAATAQRRAQLRDSLASGKPLTSTLAADAQLQRDYKYDEAGSAAAAAEATGAASASARKTLAQEREDLALLDDEYALLSGLADPRPLLTTSRSPSARLSTFAKELRLMLPTAVRLNRGTQPLPALVGAARAAGLTDAVLVHERRGTPAALTVGHLPHGPSVSFSLHNVVLRADLPGALRGSVAESYPHLVFEGFETPLGRRVRRVLAHLFPPREAVGSGSGGGKVGNRVVSFVNRDDCIEVRHHVFVRTGRAPGKEGVELAEVGPRMTMRPFEVRAGSLEEKDSGEVEWRLNQYMRTSKKKNYL